MKLTKITFLHILVVLIYFSSCKVNSPQQDNLTLKFDGLYFTEQNTSNDAGDYRYYLRFYENGKVIGTSSTGTPEEVIKWLKAEAENLSVGEFLLTRNEITFDLKSSVGEVSYKGKVLADELILSSESKINGYKATNRYKFKSLNSTD